MSTQIPQGDYPTDIEREIVLLIARARAEGWYEDDPEWSRVDELLSKLAETDKAADAIIAAGYRKSPETEWEYRNQPNRRFPATGERSHRAPAASQGWPVGAGVVRTVAGNLIH